MPTLPTPATAMRSRAIFACREWSKDPDGFVKRYAKSKWEKAIILLSGFTENSDDLVNRLVKPFWRYFYTFPLPFEIKLAAKCIGASDKVGPETTQQVITLLDKIIRRGLSRKRFVFWLPLQVSGAFETLGWTRTVEATEILAESLDNHQNHFDPFDRGPGGFGFDGCSMCYSIIKALQKSPMTANAQNVLCDAVLRHPDTNVRTDGSMILAQNMSEHIRSRMLQVLEDTDEKHEVRYQALSTLRGRQSRAVDWRGRFTDEVIESFVRMLLDKEDNLSHSIASILGLYKGEDAEEKIVAPLTRALLENLDPEIRRRSVYALGCRSDSPSAQREVIRAMDDDAPEVRTMAISRLTYMNNEHLDRGLARIKLSEMFDQEDIDVKINALEAYGNIVEVPSTPEKIQLVNLLKDDDFLVKRYAAEVLGKLKVRSTLDEHKQMAREETSPTPFAFAVWSVRQMEPDFPKTFDEELWELIFMPLLSDDDLEQQKLAVEVLRRIGTEVSLPALKEIRRDYERSRGIGGINYAIWDIEERLGLPRS